MKLFKYKNFYKGNLHTHTTKSDGKKTYDATISWYKKRGYDFLAVTDHDIYNSGEQFDDFLLLSGIELHHHTVGIALNNCGNDQIIGNKHTQQDEIDLINKNEGIPVVAHPYWHGLTMSHLHKLENYSFIEIYNSECDYLNGRGYSTTLWDYLLESGRKIFGFAVDDIHWRRYNEGKGWIMVNCGDLERNSLIQQIKQGKFYSSQGPEIKQIIMDQDNNEISINCSPCTRINFITNPPFGTVFTGKDNLLEEGHFQPPDHSSFVRIECIDEKGLKAWSNPIFL